MRQTRTLLACFAIIAAMPSVSKADPIQATVSMSVGALYGTTNYLNASNPTTFIEGPTQFSGILSPQNGLWYSTGLSGPTFGLASPLLPSLSTYQSLEAQAPFTMTITMDGASGVDPAVTITGTMKGGFFSEPLTPQTEVPGLSDNVVMGFTGTPTAANVQGWTASSGIPASLINQLLNLSNYSINNQGYDINDPNLPPIGINLQFNTPIDLEAPEPATVLLYVGAIVGLGARRATRRWRSKSQL